MMGCWYPHLPAGDTNNPSWTSPHQDKCRNNNTQFLLLNMLLDLPLGSGIPSYGQNSHEDIFRTSQSPYHRHQHHELRDTIPTKSMMGILQTRRVPAAKTRKRCTSREGRYIRGRTLCLTARKRSGNGSKPGSGTTPEPTLKKTSKRKKGMQTRRN